jgi:hypothetical protein
LEIIDYICGMKKLILTLALSLWAIISFSQIWAKAVSLTIGVRDDAYSKFTWGETRKLSGDILVKFDAQEVTIYTEDIQYYQTLKPEYFTEDGNGSYWYSVDEDRKRCKVYLYYKGGDIVMVEYDDVCIIYGILY